MNGPRFSILLNGSETLPVKLPLERAERVAKRAVSKFGRFDSAEILDADGIPFLTYFRA